jgi:transposase
MLTLPPAIRVFVSTAPVDMRHSFDRLAARVEGILQQDPFSGHLFVFRNRPGDKVKILFWDRSGFCLIYKRLEQGTFRFPRSFATQQEIDSATLGLILEGIDLSDAKYQRRYRRAA